MSTYLIVPRKVLQVVGGASSVVTDNLAHDSAENANCGDRDANQGDDGLWV